MAENQAWEDVASDVSDAVEKALQPLIRKASDDIYAGLLDATQDYLQTNLAFNIASRISTAERDEYASRRRAEAAESLNAELLKALKGLLGDVKKPGLYRMEADDIDNARAAIARATGAAS